MEAIETRYKGYRFRSRLEAKWAVFFDAMGIEWLYENEGYRLPSGLYLPDFWLPQVETHAEVKPVMPTTPRAWQLCRELCEATQQDVLVLDGMPSTRNYWGWEYLGWNPNTGIIYTRVINRILCFAPGFWDGDPVGSFPTASDKTNLQYPARAVFLHETDCPAIATAKSARFEHGETPQIHIEPKHPLTSKPDEEFARWYDRAKYADPSVFYTLPKSKPTKQS